MICAFFILTYDITDSLARINFPFVITIFIACCEDDLPVHEVILHLQ